jgi:hydrogenase maturation protease
MSNNPKNVVLGIGNTLLGDDGAGVRAMEFVRDSHPAADVAYVDGGTLSFSLARYVEEAEHLIVIDAANIGGAAGDWTCFVDEAMDGFLCGSGRSVHEVSLRDLLDMARLVGRLPRRRALFGIQPHRVHWGETLSPRVAAAVAETADRAWELLLKWQRER